MQQKQPKSSITELVLASHNKGKLDELQSILEPYGVQVMSAADLDLDEPEETGTTFKENAKIKALAAAKATGKYVLSDDSGLSCSAMDGAPGVYSARYAKQAGDYPTAMKQLYDEGYNHDDYKAAYVCVLAFATPDGEVSFFEGRCEGTMVWPMVGDNGFGYDPFFVPNGDNRTFGEMTKQEKERFSHRAKALQKFINANFS